MLNFIRKSFSRVWYRFLVLILSVAESLKDRAYVRYKKVFYGGAVCLVVLLCGCQTVRSVIGYTIEYLEQHPEIVQKAFVKGVEKAKEELADYFANIKDEEERKEAEDNVGQEDAVPFAELTWPFGGFNGSGATRDPNITLINGRFDKNRISFSYKGVGISSWGFNKTDASGALACYFVKDNNGKWVGGKFDWISESRMFRDLDHLHGVPTGYNGWDLSNVPNPTEACFVIVGWKNSKRSNVISGKWTR